MMKNLHAFQYNICIIGNIWQSLYSTENITFFTVTIEGNHNTSSKRDNWPCFVFKYFKNVILKFYYELHIFL